MRVRLAAKHMRRPIALRLLQDKIYEQQVLANGQREKHLPSAFEIAEKGCEYNDYEQLWIAYAVVRV